MNGKLTVRHLEELINKILIGWVDGKCDYFLLEVNLLC